MEMVFCPGCAGDLHDDPPACPVCGAPRCATGSRGPRRNPFKLIALCVLYGAAIWFSSMFAIGAASGPHGGLLLLASIFLSLALTASGKLPGTARP